ncbi:MAG TPA: PQQ-dependent dehydrogenase, methanol/ethanol family [Steroidobacteraceae bacterium]|jgi:alcohol dehydrogenase (cytochrome c)/quinohemoprotein ethanol dehydrogenase
MHRLHIYTARAAASLLGLGLCLQALAGPAAVDASRLTQAAADGANWMSYGRTYDEQRFSPLTQINADNVQQLGLAWFADLDTNRGQEGTPLVVDGVLYTSTAWSMVKAYDAASGKLLWSFDPQVPRAIGPNICCDAVSRGVAAWKGSVYVGTLDGRLIALDAANGMPRWSVQTTDPAKRMTITQAPRVVKDRVIIGMSGGEYNSRGYLSAYDSATGKLVWRFYTIPGDPSKPFEAPILAKAAHTWSGQWWKFGGGGTTWDAIAYDPQLDLLYFGTDNGDPWNAKYRSENHGDNLFLTSIIALRPETGEYVWHYQLVPGDEWDYSATQQIILADIKIGGQLRKVLMQAPKDGFFYVLDRKTGKLLSAKPFATVNWASRIDLKTGRPVENPAARYTRTGKPWVSVPGAMGAHSWQPMSYSPQTGLVYIPANETGFPYVGASSFDPKPRGMNNGLDKLAGDLPPDAAARAKIAASLKGSLLAWNPSLGREAWHVDLKGPWNGGLLSTGGNLLFEGNAAGEFVAYRADTGARLWSQAAQTGVLAGPITYEVNGVQYVAILAGWGGVFPLVAGEMSDRSGRQRNVSRLLVYKLGGRLTLPATPGSTLVLNPPDVSADPATLATGHGLYANFCGDCHGSRAYSGGVTPDLRASPLLASDGWFDVVLGGALKNQGMASFADVLDRTQAAAVRSWIISVAQQDKAAAGTR